MNSALRIAINAQLTPDLSSGGVQTILIGLISSLGKLTDGDEEYIIIGSAKHWEWLKAYIGNNQRIVPGSSNRSGSLFWFVNRIRRADWKIRKSPSRHLSLIAPRSRSIPVSNGFYEKLGCQVIHFPYQHFVICAMPSIYNPHDLQHLHYPHFFTASDIAYRETVYRASCDFSHTVAVGSEWIKQDVIKHYSISPQKVQVIPWAAPTLAFSPPTSESIDRVRERYGLNLPFAFYPAATWEHKNHIRLLEALAYLRNRENLRVNLVCTGSLTPFWPQIERRILDFNLNDQVKFLGVVPGEELRAIYRLAQFVIIPTLFEAASGPVFEAWEENVPVSCSNVTSLPQQAGEAALIFNPLSVMEIADSVKKMAKDAAFRTQLVNKGHERLKVFSWQKTAKAYRAVYRRAANRPLTEEDEYLLHWDWMSASSRSKDALHD